MTELRNLIDDIKISIKRKDNYIYTLRSPKILVESLEDLYKVVGHDAVKTSVAEQIMYIIVEKQRNNDKKSMPMLNTALYGDPGIGKTMIGLHLSKIWWSLNFLDAEPEIYKDFDDKKDKKTNTNQGRVLVIENNTNNYVYVILFIFSLLFLSMIIYIFYKIGKLSILTSLVSLLVSIFFFLFLVYFYQLGENDSYKISLEKPKEQNKEIVEKETKKELVKEPIHQDDVKIEDIITVVSREDLVEQYVGWTAKKTKKVLMENLGKVLFIDEAYSLINGPHDDFGRECINTINRFLSEYAGKIIVIIAGYQKDLEEGPFKAQPGFARRFMWHIHCPGYNYEELFRIFKLQMSKDNMKLKDENEVYKLFERNKNNFPNYGGDTERLLHFAKTSHAKDCIKGNSEYNVLEYNHVENAMKKLIENNVAKLNDKKRKMNNNIEKMIEELQNDNEMYNLLNKVNNKNNNDYIETATTLTNSSTNDTEIDNLINKVK